jgi:2-methylcitrate dehydratase
VRVQLLGGAILAAEKSDYEGFLTRPMSWERARQKFERLAGPRVGAELLAELAGVVADLDERKARDLTALLERASTREPTRGEVR